MTKLKTKIIPYGKQQIDEDDIKSVIEVLRSEWLTTGPQVDIFETALAQFTDAKHAVALNSGTAGLHASMYCAGIQHGDEVIVPSMTFAATANAVVFQGGTPVFADIEPNTLLIDPNIVEPLITSHTKAIVAVDYAGQPCNYTALKKIADKYNLILIADACHSIGAEYQGVKTGNLADLTVFSFHPVKHITTGEGGAVLTNNKEFAQKIRKFRNHGISTDHRQRAEQNSWFYTMDDLGYNYRITDLQCALGTSQLKKLPAWLEKRQYIADCYSSLLKNKESKYLHIKISNIKGVEPLEINKIVKHAYHLYVIKINFEETDIRRDAIFSAMRSKGIGVNVHYIPVHLHPFYQKRFGCKKGDCPQSEKVYEQILSLPIFPAMTNENIMFVINSLNEILSNNK